MSSCEFQTDFGGFYESIHQWQLENILTSHLGVEYEVNSTEYNELLDKYDWAKLRDLYCKELINELNDLYDLRVSFKGIDYPDYYNYRTDKIIATIEYKDIERLEKKYSKDKNFIDFVNKNTKSYDGYISFYKNFDDVMEYCHAFMAFLCEYLICYVGDYHLMVDWIELNIDEYEIKKGA